MHFYIYKTGSSEVRAVQTTEPKAAELKRRV